MFQKTQQLRIKIYDALSDYFAKKAFLAAERQRTKNRKRIAKSTAAMMRSKQHNDYLG